MLEESYVVSSRRIVQGAPAEEILRHARTLDADLIAMATHACGGRRRTQFGSVAREVLGRADRGVLLQRPSVHANEMEWESAKDLDKAALAKG